MLRSHGAQRLAQACVWRGLGASSALLQPQTAWQLTAWQQHVSQQQQQQLQSTLWPSQQAYHATTQLWQQHSQQHPQQQEQPEQQRRNVPVLKLYKGKWIMPVRFLVRGKIFQVMGGGSIAILLASLAMEEATSTDVLALTALAGGMVAASCCLWYYSRRYVGEMALMMPDAQRVRFSVLDFWGNREDVVVPIAAMKPPFKGVRKKEVDRLASQILFPVTVEGDRQYYLSIHAGKLFQPQVFISLMKGEFNPQDHPPVLEAQQLWQQKMQQQAAVLQTRQQQQQQQQQPEQSRGAEAQGYMTSKAQSQ